MTAKELLQNLLDRLPADAALEDVQVQIFVLQKLQSGEADIAAVRVVPHNMVMQDLARWVK
jgi:predicted transcriptional regulator